ncbi:class I SAM-dependent methyltransferase [Streptomyces massasporeus]|uniref:class I SAM-dependent methyltransferase n=1 Tax=Streptomyces massasporeus TaxID=67324 RepID=UPI0036992334
MAILESRKAPLFRSFFLASHLYRHGIALPGKGVLDVGTGTGALARLFAQAGARVTVLDPAGPLLDQARELDREAGVETDCRVGTADCRVGAAEATGLPDA